MKMENTEKEKKVYGYVRVSTERQSIQRQMKKIKSFYPDAIIFYESKSGSNMANRPEFLKLLKILDSNSILVVDEISRFSRSAQEGFKTYMELLDKGVEMIFLSQHHLDSKIYKDVLESQINATIQTGNDSTDELLQGIIDCFKKFQVAMARRQIEVAFTEAQNEIDYLHRRTKEGMKIAKENGHIAGRTAGKKYETKKSKEKKEIIRTSCKRFGGKNSNKSLIKSLEISENTFYKYVKEIEAEIEAEKQS